MPQAAPFFAGLAAAAGASAAAAVAIGTFAAFILQQASMTFLTRLLSRKGGRGLPPINVTIRSTISERRLCFGTVRAGGAFLFIRTSGSNNKYLWYVIAYAGHQCEDVRDLYLDKFKVEDADINAGTGAVSTAALDGKLKCWTHLGTQAQTVDTNLDSEFTEWTSTHLLRGICYRVLRMERSDKAWPNGAPQSASSIVDGMKLYDPRLDSTNGGAGSHRYADPSTWAFSRNAALVVRWFISGGSVINDDTTCLVKYGLRESNSRIDDAYITAAANICDQSLSGANAPPSGAQVRYTCDLEATCGQTRREILEEMLECLGPGQLVWLHGKWRLYAGGYDAPTHTFTELDLHGEIETQDTSGEENRFNQISAVYIDANKDFTEQTTVIRTNAAYVTQDGGKKILKPVTLRGVTDEYRAQRIAERMLRQARQMRTVTTTLGRQGLAVAPWETASISHTRWGWVDREFRCVERQPVWNQDNGLQCKLTWQALDASVDVDLETADYTTGTSVTNSLQSEAPDAPGSLTATSLLHAIQLDWTLGDFWQRNGAVEIYEYTSSTPFSSATLIATVRGTRAVIAKNDFTTRYYWVRVLTVGGQASSTEPASTGVAGVALPSDGVVSDPEFALSTSNDYWWRYDPGGGTSASIAITGGRRGGLATFVANGAGVTNSLVSRRKINYEFIDRQQFTIRVRARKSGSWDGVLYLTGLPHDEDSSSNTFTPSVSGASYGDIQVAGSALSTSWQEYYAICQCNLTTNAPYMSLMLSAVGGTTGTLEVDLADMTDGFANDIPEVTYTSSTNLTNADVMKRVIYTSGSGGNIRLPAAGNEIVGAKVWVEQRGAGLATLTVIGGGVHNILSYPGGAVFTLPLSGQYSTAICECVSSTTWRVVLQV